MGVAIPLGFDWDKAAYAASAEIKTLFMRTGREISDEYSKLGSKMLSAFDGSGFAQQQAAMRAEMARTAAAELESSRQVQRAYDDVYAARLRANEMVTKYGVGSSQAAASVGRLADAEAVATREAKSHAEAVAASSAAHDKLDNSLAATAGSAAAMSRVFNVAGVASMAGLGITMAETTKKASDFQQQMLKLQYSAGELPDNVKTVSDGILKLTGQVGYGTNALADAMYTIEKAGYRGADGIKVLTAAAQGAGAEQADLVEVVNGLTTSMKDFNVAPEKATELMSKMVTAVGESKSTFQEFAGALHSVEPAAAQAHLRLEDVWGVLAQITQSGTSAAQAAVDMNQAITSLARPNEAQSKKMMQLGISPDDVSQGLGERGLGGSMEYLYQKIAEKQDSSTGLVDTGELTQNAGALSNLHKMLNEDGDGALSDGGKKLAEGYLNGQVSAIEYRKAVAKSNAEDKKKLLSFEALTDSVNDFSKKLKGGRDTLETTNAALGDVTGTAEAASVAFQVTGEHAKEVEARTKAIADTMPALDGTVKGFNETQGGLNAKMRDAKAAFEAAAIEIGGNFVPVMTQVATAAKDVGDFLAAHPALTHGAVTAMEDLSLVWVGWKLISSDTALAIRGYFRDIMASSVTSAAAQAGDQGRIKTAATEANTALGSARAEAAGAGASAVEEASLAEVRAQERVGEAATLADGKLSGVLGKMGGLLKGLGPIAGMLGTDFVLDKVGEDPTGGMLNTAAALSWMGGPLPGALTTLAVGSIDAATSAKRHNDNGDWNREAEAEQARKQQELDRQNAQVRAPVAAGIDQQTRLPVVAQQPSLQDQLRARGVTVGPNGELLGPDGKPVSGHVDGGPIHGPGPKGKDSVLMWGAPGEHVLTAPEVDKLGGHGAVHALRSAIRGYEGGGAVGVDDVKAFAQGVGGHGYTWGGGNGDTFDTDCSGAQSTVANFISGAKGRFATLSEESALMSRGFHMGDPPAGVAAYWVGWRNGGPGGGRTAGTIVDPNGGNVNVEMGGKAGNGQYGGNAAGAAGFPNRAWIALGGGDDPSKGNSSNVLGGGGGGSLSMGGAGLGSAGGGGIGSGGGGGGGMWSSLASTLTEFLLQLAMGNPMGQLAAQGIGGPGGGRNSNTMTRYQNSLLRAAERQEKANESIEKLQQRQDDVAKELKIAEEHLAEVKANPKSKASTRDGAQLRVDKLRHEQSSIAGKLAAGPISGPGPLGKDSQLAPVAPGEYVLTADQVGHMGGPQGVQNWLSGSMRGYEDGGAVGDGYQSRQASSGQGGSGGVDVGGGSLGMAESAGAMALNALAPGAGEGAQIGMQEANRAAKYGASLAGIGIQGLFETLALNDSVIGDPSKSWIGRFAGGLAGTHPTSQNSAGMTQQPQQPKDKQPEKPDQGDDDRGPSIGVNIEQLHSHNGDGEAIARDINRQTQQYAMNTR